MIITSKLNLFFQVPRATDPVCLFVDESGLWSAAGIETILPVNEIEKGEVKQFSVTCSSNHLTAFGVAVDTDASVRLIKFVIRVIYLYYVGLQLYDSSIRWMWFCHLQFSVIYILTSSIFVITLN